MLDDRQLRRTTSQPDGDDLKGHDWASRTVLVTGGAGFIGSCLVRYLIEQLGARVVNLDKLTYAGNLDSLESVRDNPRHIFVRGDICDGRLLLEILRKHRPHSVFNLAAESHVDRSIDGPADFVNTNVVGTFRLLEACRHYYSELDSRGASEIRFVHVSTDEVYGSLGSEGAFSEDMPYRPNSPYSASKAAADHFARAYSRTYGLPVVTTNCSNNYGPYQFPEKLIPLMILNALEGRGLPVYGDGENIRDWLHVEDHVRALIRVAEAGVPGEVYNIGAQCEKRNLEVVRAICEVVDRLRPVGDQSPSEELIKFVPDRPGHDRRYAIDSTKVRQELNWAPRETFESGLEATVRWYMENQRWVDRVTSGIYQRERLGLTPTAHEC